MTTKNLIKSITASEWKLIIWTTVFIIIITTAPYIYGWFQTPTDHTYTGLHSLTPGDMHVYFSYMEQVKQGYLLSEDIYTSEPQSRVILNGFWSSLGLFSLITKTSNYFTFQLFRIILIPLFIISLYLISSWFWQKKIWRKICFIFLCFGSGLGVIIYPFLSSETYIKGYYNLPLDMWAPENNNLLTILQSPHLISATALIILILLLFYFATESNKTSYSLGAGILSLSLFQFHPFHIPTILAVISIYIIILSIKYNKILYSYLKHFLIIIAISSPSILYYSVLEKYDFITQIRTYQNICLTPSLLVVFFSYGFLILLSIYALYKIISSSRINNKHIFLAVWLIVQFSLLYSPLPFQRRLMQGLQIPMIILAVYAIYHLNLIIKSNIKPKKYNYYFKNKYLAIIIFIIFFTPSNLYNLTRDIVVFKKTYPQLYIHNDIIAGYNWLKQNTSPDDVILSDLYNGNLIPGHIGRKIFVGHGVETLFFESKLGLMAWFFSTNNYDLKKQIFLRQNSINYIFFSPNEKGIGDFNPSSKKYLKLTFKQNETEIYQVIK